MKLFLLTLVLAASSIAGATNIATNDLTSTTTLAGEKPWHILFDANHQPNMRNDQFTSTDFTLFFDYKLNPQNSLRVTQGLNKKYVLGLEQGQNEWEASDTILAHYWNTPYSVGPFALRWVTGVYLPTSVDAQDHNKLTTISGSLQANAVFWNRYSLSIRPFARYNWYKYKTTISGDTLPAFSTGITLVNSVDLTKALSINGTFSYNYVYDYASQYDHSTRLGGYFDDNASGRYGLDLAVNYSWTDKVAMYVGYSAGDAYIKDGRYEVYAYDPKTTRASLGVTLYF